jgi:hypothetical protein
MTSAKLLERLLREWRERRYNTERIAWHARRLAAKGRSS